MLVISKRFPSLIKEGVLWISDGFKLLLLLFVVGV